jgi:hypothetical protein
MVMYSPALTNMHEYTYMHIHTYRYMHACIQSTHAKHAQAQYKHACRSRSSIHTTQARKSHGLCTCKQERLEKFCVLDGHCITQYNPPHAMDSLSESLSGFALTIVQFRTKAASLSTGQTTIGSRARREGFLALSVWAIFISTEWHVKLGAVTCSLLGESRSMRNNTMQCMVRAEMSVFFISNPLSWQVVCFFCYTNHDICGSWCSAAACFSCFTFFFAIR